MFETLADTKPDAILALMDTFREDPRADKLDFGVGMYKDDKGHTPIMHAVKVAERQLLENQNTKAYVSPLGSSAFCKAMVVQVFGADADVDRIRCAQAPGGSGALRILADLLQQTQPKTRIWMSDPTWPNHKSLFSNAGFELSNYRYYDANTGQVDSKAMLADLALARPGDVVLLHGCCHNPTGADLNTQQWQAVADLCAEHSLFAFVDLAYQGFAEGLEQDAEGVRILAAQLPEMAVAASCSKNFGLYRERVGAALVLGSNASNASRALAKLSSCIRTNYSMPPDHGAHVVSIILHDDELRGEWTGELTAMRERMNRLRYAFSAAMRKRSNSDRFDFVATQRGMFSRLPLSSAQIDQLRNEYGIYIVSDGRINVAGLPDSGMDELANAIANVL